MDSAGWLIFLGAVFVGSYVQSVSGFAMGLIVIAVVGASGIVIFHLRMIKETLLKFRIPD